MYALWREPHHPDARRGGVLSQVFLVSRDLGPASGYPIGTTCRVLGLSCSGYYKLPTLNAPHHLEFALNGSRSSASRPVPVLSTYTC